MRKKNRKHIRHSIKKQIRIVKKTKLVCRKKHNKRAKELFKKKFGRIAAITRDTTVNNMPKSKPTIKDGIKTESVKFGEKDVKHVVQVAQKYKAEKHKQPRKLRSSVKKWAWVPIFTKESGWTTVRKLIQHKSEYPNKDLKKMTRQEYWEKLVQHKLSRWERKNPKPHEDLFEDVEKWEQLRQNAEERIRDFVVSMYDKLPLEGRFEINKTNATYMEEKIAEIKDMNGDGHRINEVGVSSPLIKKAQTITNKTKAKRHNLICTNLKDHKRRRGRIILPEAA